MADPIRLYVVDDHALFREGLLRLLENDPLLKIVGNSGSLSEASQQISELEIDILILDYDLGDDNALSLVQQLKNRGFAGRILLVTAGLPNHDALELIRMGVSGIFHKQHPPADLHRSILEVAEGKVLIEQNYLKSLVESATLSREAAPRLTERDKQILRLLLEGQSNKEIAAHLQLSESAVKASLQQLFAKAGVRTRSQLVRIALEKLRDDL